MKLATYNIASGGFSGYDSTHDKPERLNQLQEAISSIDADVIGLTDTFRWADIFTPKQIQDTFNYPYSLHIDMNDTRVDRRIGVALLSRHPITASKTIRLHNRSAIQATIQWGKKEPLNIFVIYLDDLSEATRQQQVETLTKHIPNDSPTAVLGDFNAIWPSHVPELKRQVNIFLDTHPNFKEQHDAQSMHAVLDNFYQATVLPYIEARGFIEPIGLRATALTPLHPLKFPNVFPVDHILVKNCVATDYSVPSTKLFESASDHYPLVATI